MARWTVVRGEHELTLEVAGDQIALDLPSGGPFLVDVDIAQEIRRKLGAAIGVALGSDQP